MTKATRPNGPHLHLVDSQRSEKYQAYDLWKELERENQRASAWSREDLDLIVGAFAVVLAGVLIVLVRFL